MIEEEKNQKSWKNTAIASFMLIAGLTLTVAIPLLTSKRPHSAPSITSQRDLSLTPPTLKASFDCPLVDKPAQTKTFHRSGGIRRLSGGRHASKAKIAGAVRENILLNDGETWVIDHPVTRKTYAH